MDPLVVERPVRLAERLSKGVAAIAACVVLAGQKANVFHFQRGRYFAKARHTVMSLGRVVCLVRQITREDDEVRHEIDGVDRRHRVLEGHVGVRVRRPFEAPMGIRELEEEEVFPRGCERTRRAGGSRGRGRDSRGSRRAANERPRGHRNAADAD